MKNSCYKIYKADDENGEPGVFKLVKRINAFEKNGSPVIKWNDPVFHDKKYFYRISAVDDTGQESLPSDFQPTE